MHKTQMWNGTELELLSRDEESALARSYRSTGDQKLEERLVRSQLRLAAHLARGFHVGEQDLEDLTQQGAMGAVEAVRRFDPERGNRLSSYAAWWIRAYQLRYLLANHRLVRLGSTQQQRKIFWRLRTERARLTAAGEDAGPEALALVLGVSATDIEETSRRIDSKEVSIDAPAKDDRASFGSQLASHDDSPEDNVEHAQLVGLVRREAGRLHGELAGRERAVFEARFSDDAPTLAAVGKRFGVSRERARQLEKRVIQRLRTRVEKRLAPRCAA